MGTHLAQRGRTAGSRAAVDCAWPADPARPRSRARAHAGERCRPDRCTLAEQLDLERDFARELGYGRLRRGRRCLRERRHRAFGTLGGRMSEQAPTQDADRRQRTTERGRDALSRRCRVAAAQRMTIRSLRPGPRNRLDAHPPRHGERPQDLSRRPHLCARRQRFAFACNSLRQHRRGRRRDQFIAPGREGDVLRCYRDRALARQAPGIYEIEVRTSATRPSRSSAATRLQMRETDR